MLGSEPGPGTQRRRGSEPGDVPDLSDQDRGHRGADPVDGLDRPIADMTAQPFSDLALEHRDLAVVELDQISQRLDTNRVRVSRDIASSCALPAGQNMSVTEGNTPSLAITACTCALSPDRNATSFAR